MENGTAWLGSGSTFTSAATASPLVMMQEAAMALAMVSTCSSPVKASSARQALSSSLYSGALARIRRRSSIVEWDSGNLHPVSIAVR